MVAQGRGRASGRSARLAALLTAALLASSVLTAHAGGAGVPPVVASVERGASPATATDSRFVPASEDACGQIPAASPQPGQHPSGYNWSGPIRPLGDPCVHGVFTDPADERVLYVAGEGSLYVTHDGGATWTNPLRGYVYNHSVAFDGSGLTYAAVGATIYTSSDRGSSWTPVQSFERFITSIYATPNGMIYVGLDWGPSSTPNGIFFSPDRGERWTALPFGGGVSGLICWAIARDERDGTLYVATEIYNHPQPYHPPLYRSQDGGQTWTDVAPTTWHAISLAVRPRDGYVYALTEGAGLFGSATQGSSWLRLGPGSQPTLFLVMNPSSPNVLYGGTLNREPWTGGALVSADAGRVFRTIGLEDASVASLSLNSSGTTLYAAAYASGIYVSPVPPVSASPELAVATGYKYRETSTYRTSGTLYPNKGTYVTVRVFGGSQQYGKSVEFWQRNGKEGPWIPRAAIRVDGAGFAFWSTVPPFLPGVGFQHYVYYRAALIGSGEAPRTWIPGTGRVYPKR